MRWGDTEARAAAAATAGARSATARLPAGALPSESRPTPSPAGFCAGACSLRAPRLGGPEGGASAGAEPSAAGLIGMYAPNETTKTPG